MAGDKSRGGGENLIPPQKPTIPPGSKGEKKKGGNFLTMRETQTPRIQYKIRKRAF